ncbi:hypothetical protein [Acidithiobacillus sp.]|uniref:hypothetical protein n=1 Tax=Acidithiobacillus sp. TaxID=1872118 RepID=UPI00258CD652|nr:hypothetical protein [Acidithiobacillus sp.]MDD5374432.1 hypothetical protein [Acidithiobacillus sp.]
MLSEYDCSVCEDEALANMPPWNAMFLRRFIVCRTCGNKRCPKASAHWQECTDSNEVGQVGSFYGPEEHWPKAGPGNGEAGNK